MIKEDRTRDPTRPAPLRVGILAPPWLSVPPTSYGGTELMIDALGRGLQQLGHDVLLFTVGQSTCALPKAFLFEAPDPDRMGYSVLELRHAAAAYEAFAGCDIVHDHTLSGLFMGDRHTMPIVTTNHGPFNEDMVDLFRRAGHVPVIAISRDQASRAPKDLWVVAVIHHGLDTSRYRFDPTGGDYLVSLGRMNPTKGIERAIHVARRCGRDLLIAAKMREPLERLYFDEAIEPLLGGGVQYVGEVDHAAKVELLGGARALINPIQWDEPFGLAMIESLACGTPVVTTGRGAAPEIVEQGVTGFYGDRFDDLVAGVEGSELLDRETCRRSVDDRFSMRRMASDHVTVYRSLVGKGSVIAPTTS